MAGSKKKRGLTLILLLIAMIALIGACLWLTDYKEKQAKKESEESAEKGTTIASIKADTIKSITYKNDSGEMTLVLDDQGVWKNTEDENFPVNQTNAGNMQSALADVTSSRTITEGTQDLTTFGLDAPAVQITVTKKDGTTTSIAIGDKIPVGNGYYASLNKDKEVYVIDSTFYNNFSKKITDMITVETIPNVAAANVTYLAVENKDKPGFEVSYDENDYADYSGFTKWTMKKPYPTEIAADQDALTTLFGNFSNLTFLCCVDYNAKDLSKYGLDDPDAVITMKYFEEAAKETDTSDTSDADTADTSKAETTKVNKEYTLMVGSTDADGNYYVKLKDSNAVNLLSADTVTKLTDIDPYSNAYHNINLFRMDDLDSIDVSVNSKKYTLNMEKAAETEDTTETTETAETTDREAADAKYYFNGKLSDQEKFKDLYQIIISPETEREIPAEYFETKSEKTPYMTLAFHFTAGQTVTINFIPYDDSFYVVDTDGVEYFLTDLRKINDIADAVMNFGK